ncbi:MAG: hypothetical protein JWO59_18, partial [Chloroflexi bacterium]|nr:hypothetical protein [Chloroflexota bacterium]
MATSVDTDSTVAAARRRRRYAGLREHVAGYSLVAPPVLFLVLLIVYPSLKAVWDTFTTRPFDTGHGVVSV